MTWPALPHTRRGFRTGLRLKHEYVVKTHHLLEGMQPRTPSHEHKFECFITRLDALDQHEVDISQLFGPADLQALMTPFEVNGRCGFERTSIPSLFEVPRLLDPVEPGRDLVTVLVVPRIELLTLEPPEGLIRRAIDVLERIVTGQRLEMMPQLVGERLPDLVVPIEAGVLVRERP